MLIKSMGVNTSKFIGINSNSIRNSICFSTTKNNLSKRNYNTLAKTTSDIKFNQKEYFKEYIEMRSDVKTIPTKKMLDSIQNSYFGDDCFDEDPTMNKLLSKFCDLFGKEAALFVPSGTMGNMACLKLHANVGDFIIQGAKCHIYKTELPSQMILGFRPILEKLLDPINPSAKKFDSDHLTDFEIEKFSIEKKIENHLESLSFESNKSINLVEIYKNAKKPKAIVLENSHNYNGGVLLNMKYVKDIILPEKEKYERLNELGYKIGMHLDGSRVLNASVSSKISPKDLTKDFDTVNICLSKGLGAPCGSVILFEGRFYEKIKGYIKQLGGGMRQNGVLAAPALVALEDYEERFEKDHSNAKLLSQGLNNIKGLFSPETQTNIVNVYLDKDYFKVDHTLEFEKYLSNNYKVMTHSFENAKYIRCVMHHQVSTEQVNTAIKAFEQTALFFENKTFFK